MQTFETESLESVLQLPQSTISRLAKESLANTNRRIGKPGLEIINKSTSLFIAYLADAAAEIADQRKRFVILCIK